MMLPELFDETADMIDDAVDVLQQLRYGNKDQARMKAIRVAAAATGIYNALTELTAGSEEGKEHEEDIP